MSQPTTLSRREANPIHVYLSKDPYRTAAGRSADRSAIDDRLADALAVVALDADQPSAATFLRLFDRETKIRDYAPSTRRSYHAAVRSILRWFGRPPHLLTREHVKNYLEYLFDSGQSSSDVSVQLVAIRNAWDKFCFRDVTLGLAMPRRKRRSLVILSRDEVRRILEAAPSLRDTLMIGLMYGSGIRVSELCRLRWRDIDMDRNQIFVFQGKGNADRHVQLPRQYRDVLRQQGAGKPGDQYIFPSESPGNRGVGRHISPRTVQRVVENACLIAGINKQATPHSFRHAFATHSYEDGCDIRRIQTVLGHVRLETTTIYVKVSQQRTDFPSPLDRLLGDGSATNPSQQANRIQERSGNSKPAGAPRKPKSVGKLQLHTRRHPDTSDSDYAQTKRSQITIEIRGHGRREFLLGTVAQIPRSGFVTISLPPIEQWSEVIGSLPKAMQQRIADPSFYEVLQDTISRKMMSIQQETADDPAT